jgi:hypothetical protein
MQNRIEANARAALWIERIVWNAAAGAALAVMILVLLGSLRWLDRFAPRIENDPPSISAGVPVQRAPLVVDPPTAVAGVNRPSG